MINITYILRHQKRSPKEFSNWPEKSVLPYLKSLKHWLPRGMIVLKFCFF